MSAVGGYLTMWPDDRPWIRIFVTVKPEFIIGDEVWRKVRYAAHKWGEVDEINQIDTHNLRVDLLVDTDELMRFRANTEVDKSFEAIPEVQKVLVVG